MLLKADSLVLPETNMPVQILVKKNLISIIMVPRIIIIPQLRLIECLITYKERVIKNLTPDYKELNFP